MENTANTTAIDSEPSEAGAGQPKAAFRSRERPRGRYVPRRKVCQFCQDKVEYIDYKEVDRLRRFVSERGKMEPRRKTGTCASHQRALTTAIKRARYVALLPFTSLHALEPGFYMSPSRSHARPAFSAPQPVAPAIERQEEQPASE